MSYTTAEVGAILGIGCSGVRMLVLRGQLTPERPGARPLRFSRGQVWALRDARDGGEFRALAADLWDRADVLASQVSDV